MEVESTVASTYGDDEIDLDSTKSLFRVVSEQEENNNTCRKTMEDVHFVNTDFLGDGSMAAFGVFDGHGGVNIALFLKQNYQNILREIIKGNEYRTADALSLSLLEADSLSAKENIMYSGSTAAVCLISEDEKSRRVLYVCNLGDTRVVLRQGQSTERLSVDHSPTVASEQARIEETGGFVMKGRTMGMLSVSRALGDHQLKKYVICRPYSRQVVLDGSEDFFIIACDGVWEVFTDEDATEFICQGLEKKEFQEHQAAEALVNAAVSKGSQDNVTALVVFL